MSGVRAAQSLALERATDDVDAMQDVLYDILATGLDPEQADAPTEQIERFLFEHARAPKPAAEFRAFFEEHGLTVRREMGAASMDSFALPPLEVVAAPPPAAMHLPHDEVGDADDEVTGQHATQAGFGARSAWGMRAIWAGLALLCVGLVGALWAGYGVIQELRGDLDRAEQRSAEQDRVIDQLEGRAVGIQSSIEANGQLIQRMEQKSDLLIESLIHEPEPPRQGRWSRR